MKISCGYYLRSLQP